jgi:nitroreductase
MSATPKILDDQSLDTLFREGRSFSQWQDKDVSAILLKAVYDLMKFGPTEANSCPARFVFVQSAEAKARLKPHLDAGNVNKVMSAPVTVIIAQDMKFYDQMGKLFPHAPGAREWFAGNDEKIARVALRNSSLQAAYLMLAARSLGLDCGPMAGFNADGLNREFFPDGQYKVNFICALGYGDRGALFPRNPRLSFDEACEIL